MAEPCRDSNNGGLYCVYLARCSDGSYYCGIALDLQKRLRQHNEGKGSRYTASRRPVVLEFSTECRFTRAEAQVIEIKTKRQGRVAKRTFLEGTERKAQEPDSEREPKQRLKILFPGGRF
ncbi:MAG: GIY-YIG nuclease family protein [Thermovirgaceae bacterium]|nr:GIY-YIG nuclease family protein [Thermovirgaceae bacterium]